MLIFNSMLKLNSHKHPYLTETVNKTLTQNRIVTVLDFLLEDAQKLAIITKLNLSQIIELRRNIYTNYAAPILCSSDILLSLQNDAFFSTGIECLDYILDGGIPTRYVTEICGLAGSGKSQLCMQIAINHAKRAETTVLYIDTKGDFSAVRIQKILEYADFTHKEIAAIMLKIKIVYIWNMENLIDLMKVLRNRALENLSLIFIDSLPSLMFQHFGDNNKIGFTYLNTLVSHLKYLCKEMQLSVICVNLQTRWIDMESANPDEELDSEKLVSTYQEKRIRCLGKYWQHIPYLVINLEKQHTPICENTNSINYTASVHKCNIPQIYRSCDIKIGLAGIS